MASLPYYVWTKKELANRIQELEDDVERINTLKGQVAAAGIRAAAKADEYEALIHNFMVVMSDFYWKSDERRFQGAFMELDIGFHRIKNNVIPDPPNSQR